MIFCKELNKTYLDKKELFSDLRTNKEELLSTKKALRITSLEKGIATKSKCLHLDKVNGVNKEAFQDSDFYYIVVNTTNILDSHKDLHVRGIWNKTAKERSRKNYLVDTHTMSMMTTIARKEHVQIFVAEIPFSAVGKSYQGTTEALVYKIRKDKIINQIAKDWLDSGDDIEASVSMQYVKIDLAMDSDLPEDVEERKTFHEYKSHIANIDEHDNLYYYWVVREAKNDPESSLVLQASNPYTGNITLSNKAEPLEDTQPPEPLKDTQSEVIDFIKSSKFI